MENIGKPKRITLLIGFSKLNREHLQKHHVAELRPLLDGTAVGEEAFDYCMLADDWGCYTELPVVEASFDRLSMGLLETIYAQVCEDSKALFQPGDRLLFTSSEEAPLSMLCVVGKNTLTAYQLNKKTKVCTRVM